MVKHLSSKILSLIALLLLAPVVLFGQSGPVSGVITDESDGSTLVGVSIVVKGTVQGTISDMNGRYSIVVEPGTTLVFSYVGYTRQEILVQPNTTVNVALQSEMLGIKEVVIIGYGTQKKKDATGSVVAIGTDDFNRGSNISVPSLMTGKIAGVQVINDGGAPGGAIQIRIRGGSSLSASNDPLIVLDGVPLDNETIDGARNALNILNPNDIESMTVLKDASATAIYGSRASNGVILITTKQGLATAPFKVDYTGTFSFYTPTRKIDVLSADEFRGLIEEKHPGRVGMMGTANTEWQEEIFRNAFGMDHYLSFSGASKYVPYRVSLGYSGQDGILKTDNLSRTTLGFKLVPTLLDEHLKINLNGQGSFVKNRFADWGAISAALQFDPTQPVYDLDNSFGGYWAWTQANGNPVDQATSNPVALLDLRRDRADVYGFIGSAQFDYKIHGFEDLRLNLNLGLDYSTSDGRVDLPAFAAWQYDPLYGGGVDREYDQEKRNLLLDFYLNYVKEVASIDSRFDAMAGYSYQRFRNTGSTYETNVINPAFETVIRTNTDYASESVLISFFGRFNYAFKDKYLLTLTLRNDGTSRFSEDTRWGLFPSVALAWKINEESFLRDSRTISQLKLRAGWGITGQQNIGQGDYPYLPRYTTSETTARYQIGEIFYNTLRAEGYDAHIKWEETTTYNLGLDYGFNEDRFYGSLDFYFRKTADLINLIPVPAGSNLTNYILTNIGDLENKGVEFSIFTRPVVRDNFQWELGFNVTYNKNEITKLTATDDSAYLGVETGGIAGGVGNNIQMHSVGFPASSFFVYEQVYDADGNPIQGLYVDRNADGQINNADRYHYKKPAADLYFGISSIFNYKNWQFSFSGRANFGNFVYNNVVSENAVYERLYRPEGPYLSNINSEVFVTGFNNPQYLSDYFIEDASFFRMDYISLSHVFTNISNTKLNLRISATVNNVFVITRYTGLDPEIQDGIDDNVYPRPRVYVLSLNLQF